MMVTVQIHIQQEVAHYNKAKSAAYRGQDQVSHRHAFGVKISFAI